MASIRWIPESKKPADADAWATAIDAACGTSGVGKVELVWTDACWRVERADWPSGGSSKRGRRPGPMSRDMTATVREALKKAGRPVC
jgi:hypothetical protein